MYISERILVLGWGNMRFLDKFWDNLRGDYKEGLPVDHYQFLIQIIVQAVQG